ncbi:GNAT family N-acetyltransferase [Roseomonas elaeocarpi]|uniref:GNAT family N-acetyltransferase n=1 Tax=Roseomonas elaeocarpi TaxID=907779 RepID=A0ABV6JTP2_9PROT
MILHTARLRLRPFRAADVAALADLRADPATMRFMAGGEAAAAPERASAEAGSLASLWGRAWEEGHPGYAPWAVERRGDGCFLGAAGLRWLPFEGGTTEVMWMIHRHHRRQGYATEAAEAACRWGFATLGLAQLDAFVMPRNEASLGVVRRLGMAPLGETTILDMPMLRFRLLAPGKVLA